MAFLPATDSHRECVESLSPSQGYQTLADLHRGQRILVLGGSGGVGTVGVQIARHIGAHVIATCSGRNVALVRSLGADEVIDYTAVDLATLAIEPVDVVYDTVGGHYRDTSRLLRPGGVYLTIAGDVHAPMDIPRLVDSAYTMVARSWPFTAHKYRFYTIKADSQTLKQCVLRLCFGGASCGAAKTAESELCRRLLVPCIWAPAGLLS